MRIIVGNKIEVENPTPEIISWCKENLVLSNPEYYKRQRMGKWLGNTPQSFALYEKNGGKLYLPFGCVADVARMYGSQCRLQSAIKPFKTFDYDSAINPYPYQENAVKMALKAKNGVIVMPCGAGKTQTALEIIARIGAKCLWLTHTQDLLNQSLDRAKSVLGAVKSSYGKITAGKVDIGEGITFATVQTMAKLDLSQYRDEWGVIIIDEVQHCAGSPTRVTQFYRVLSNLSARYKFGVTATPHRADGLERSIFALVGNIICEVSKEEVKSTTCPVEVQFVDSGYEPDFDAVLAGDGTINYSALVTDMTENAGRFERVLEIIENARERGGMIVLANRVDYLQRLDKRFGGKSVCLSGNAGTKKAREVRKDALRMLNCGELDCIFSTYQLSKEGLDVPNLRTIIFATPEKDSTTVTQAAGRVARKCEGKDAGLVIDIVDRFGMYKGWQKKRISYYKKLDFLLTL